MDLDRIRTSYRQGSLDPDDLAPAPSDPSNA
jgi:hypothetical protein